mgnify:CR=1 FL=1
MKETQSIIIVEMKMKLVGSLLIIIVASACSSKPNTDIIVEKKEHLMHRQEVINAIEDCKDANLLNC